MIKRIKINNYKSIKELSVELKNLNLFTGVNSSGKSTSLQALLLVSQNITRQFGLNGPLVSVGEFGDAKNFNLNEKVIRIEVSDDKGMIILNCYEDEKIEIKKEGDVNDCLKQINYECNRLHYLSCNRVGSQDTYQKNRTEKMVIGINGEFAIDYLSRHKTDELDEKLRKNPSDFTLHGQINYWLNYIIGAEIKVEHIRGTEVIKAEYGMNTLRFSRPQNVGSGISYLISILVLCLASNEEDILIIENPEIHLHPAAQSRLCEFLYWIANSERQVFIETHSDHFFNSVRVGIAKGDIESDKILIGFFEKKNDNTIMHNIKIGKYGAIMNPVKNLFDQFQIDLDKMLGI